MATSNDFVKKALSQDGDKYVFGVEVKASDLNPTAFDCAELVQWALARFGVTFTDGSWLQYRACKNAGKSIPVSEGVITRGALLFRFSSDPMVGPRPSSAHVAISQGNGYTIEARSTKTGVGVFPTAGRGWTHAGLVPGLDYSTAIADGVDDWAREDWEWAKAIGVLSTSSSPQSVVTDQRLAKFLNRLMWWARSQFVPKV